MARPIAVRQCDGKSKRSWLRKMAEVHKLLGMHGKAGVLQLDFDRRVVEAAAGYLGSEESEVGYLYSGWAQSALPHKRQPDDAPWSIETDHVSLIVQPGLRPVHGGKPVSVGVLTVRGPA